MKNPYNEDIDRISWGHIVNPKMGKILLSGKKNFFSILKSEIQDISKPYASKLFISSFYCFNIPIKEENWETASLRGLQKNQSFLAKLQKIAYHPHITSKKVNCISNVSKCKVIGV